jgi:hypothetical protein
MLTRILQEFDRATAPISLNDISQKLGIDRSALEGMVAYLVQKGKLRDDHQVQQAAARSCQTGACASCAGAQHCPFAMEMPRTFSRPAADAKGRDTA